MATWEVGARFRLALGTGGVLRARLADVTVVSGVALAVVATATLWMFRGAPQVARLLPPASVSWGALEVPAAVQAQAVPAVQPEASVVRPGGFVVSFGRFARRERAEAYARVVRSKGYIASVAQADTGFTVVSRPYASLDAARFWSTIFEEIGLEVRAVTQHEAVRDISRVF